MTARTLRTSSLALAALAALALTAARPAQAQTPGYTVTSPKPERSLSNNPDPHHALGVIFTVGANDVTVSALGYYVGGTGTLVDAHQVGIFTVGTGNSDGTQVGPTALVGPGSRYTADTFTFVPVTPFTLSANTQYIVTGDTASNTDPFLDAQTSATPGAGIASLDGEAYRTEDYQSGYNYPNNLYYDSGHVYGVANFEIAPAPEPSQLSGLGVGLLGLAGLGWKARKRA